MLFSLYTITSPLTVDPIKVAKATDTAEELSPNTFFGPPSVPTLPHGCVDSVEDLPGAEYLDIDDPRLHTDAPVIVVIKHARRVMLFSHGQIRRSDYDRANASCWPMGLGVKRHKQTGLLSHPHGHKRVRGDHKTPEGWYWTSDRPWSNFAPAITIHYPNERDAAWGLRTGKISQEVHDQIVYATQNKLRPPMETALSGKILFHGPNQKLADGSTISYGRGDDRDWTQGCIALSERNNQKLREILEPYDHQVWTVILP